MFLSFKAAMRKSKLENSLVNSSKSGKNIDV